MNILVIIIFAILLLAMFAGYRNGFLKTAFSLVSWIVILVLCNVATPVVAQVLIETTDIEVVIQSALDAKINEMIQRAMDETGVSELPEELNAGVVIEQLPEELQRALPEELKQLLLMEVSTEVVPGQIVDTASVAERAVEILALLIVLVFARIVIIVVNVVLGIAAKLPLIGPIDKVLGFVCGAGKGLIWCWVVLTIVSVLALTGVNTEWVVYISQSEFLTWLQNNNVILNLLV